MARVTEMRAAEVFSVLEAIRTRYDRHHVM